MDPTEVFVETQTRQGWRRLRLIGGVLLLLFCAGAAYYYYTSVQAERDLRNAVAHANQLDPGWTLPEIEARREVIPDEQNAILHVMTARQFQPTPPKSFQLFQGLEEMPPQEQLSAQQLESIAAEVMRAARLLEAARPIAILPKGRPNTALSQDVVSTILPHVDALSTLHIYLLFDVVKQAQEKDAEGAFRSAYVMFNSARALGDEPFAMVQMNRMLRACNALRAVERVLAQGQVSESTLADFQKVIEEEEAYPGFLIGARGERAILHVMMERLEAGAIDHTHMRKMLASFQQQKWIGTGYDRIDDIFFNWPVSKLKENHAAMLEYLSDLVEVAKLPVEDQQEAMEPMLAKYQKLPTLASALTHFRKGFADRNIRSRAELRCAAAALAAERFRLKHGRWPTSLAELVPDFLQKMPTDPYARSPLRLRRTGQGLVIYALGPDLQDDGGDNLATTRMSPLQAAAWGVDVGFRLWDVGQRRQPAQKQTPGSR